MKWDINELSVIARIGDGAHASLKRVADGIPYLTAKNITKAGIDYSNLEHIDQETYEKHFKAKSSALTKPIKGDILYSIIGSIGGVYVVRDEILGISSSVAIFRSKPEIIIPEYLAYFVKSDSFDDQIQSIKSGVAQGFMSLGKLGKVKISYPKDLEYQERVVKVLSAYDNLIENNQKQIKLLEEAAQRLYKEWFVDLRFPGYETTPIIDGVPEGWEWKPILDNDVFNFVKSRALPFEGEKTYYATADVSGTNVVSLGEKITFENKPSRAAIQPIPFSVWFARMSNSYKILNCFGANEWMVNEAILSSGFAGFTSRTEYYGFVYQTIASDYFDEEKDRYATGATQVSLTNDGLAKIQVLIPKTSVIRKYSELVHPIMCKTELLKNENTKLKEARNRLLPKLMSGELEV